MDLRISGRTRLAGLIGYPLQHSLSPAMHNAVYIELGLDWVYLPLEVEDDSDLMRVVGAIKVLPFVGFNVTMPFKQTMLHLCDEVAMLAQMAGAVNTVHCVDGRLIGYNTDGRGLLEALQLDTGFDPADRDVVILGAGGAAGAAFVAFVLGKARRITVANRNFERAEELVERVRPHLRSTEARVVGFGHDAEEAIRGADLVVNATPIGMHADDPSPVPASWLRPEQVVVDMIYRRDATPLVVAAREAGATAVDGLGMLVCQGATAVDIWNNSAQSRTPRDVMRAVAEAELKTHAAEGVDVQA